MSVDLVAFISGFVCGIAATLGALQIAARYLVNRVEGERPR